MTVLLTTAQAAERLAVSRDTVLRMIHAGELRVVQVPGRGANPGYRVRDDDLDAWIDCQTGHLLARATDTGGAA